MTDGEPREWVGSVSISRLSCEPDLARASCARQTSFWSTVPRECKLSWPPKLQSNDARDERVVRFFGRFDSGDCPSRPSLATRIVFDKRLDTACSQSLHLLAQLLLQEFEAAFELRGCLVRTQDRNVELVVPDSLIMLRAVSSLAGIEGVEVLPTRELVSQDDLANLVANGTHPLVMAHGSLSLHGYDDVDPYVAWVHDVAHIARFSRVGRADHRRHAELFWAIKRAYEEAGRVCGIDALSASVLLDTVLGGPRLDRTNDIFIWLGRDIRDFLIQRNRLGFVATLMRLFAGKSADSWQNCFLRGLTGHETGVGIQTV